MQSYSVHGSIPAAICCARSLLQQRRVSKKTLVKVLQNLGESADQLRKQRSAARPSRAAQGAIHKMVPRGCGIPAAADVAFPPRRGGTRRARHTCAFTRARRKSQQIAAVCRQCCVLPDEAVLLCRSVLELVPGSDQLLLAAEQRTLRHLSSRLQTRNEQSKSNQNVSKRQHFERCCTSAAACRETGQSSKLAV